jgi:hypothetical protein
MVMKKVITICAVVIMMLAVSGVTQAANKTYAIVDYPDYQIDRRTGLVDHVSGTITADPATGVIASASFTITAGDGGASYTVVSALTGDPTSGPAYYIHVTPTEILVTPNNPSNPLNYGDLRLYGSTGLSAPDDSAIMQWYTPGDPWLGSMNWAGYSGVACSNEKISLAPRFASNHDATPFTVPIPGSRDTMVVATVVPEPPPTVTLVPDALNAAQGSTVNVSVNMTVLSPITMAAISTNILCDSNVFTYDANSVVVKGGLLTHDWELYGNEYAAGFLRIGGIDLNWDPGYESLAEGSGTLFTFTLKVKADAPTGLSALTWGVYDGYDNATAGFDYGDADFVDIIVPDSNTIGTSINIIPAPAPMTVCALPVANSTGSAEYATGFAPGSWQANATVAGEKSEYYVSPQMLFGRDVTIGELSDISYFTMKNTTHTEDAADWYINIYTKPDSNLPVHGSWYGNRIGSEPYFSENLVDPCNTWNQWVTEAGQNNRLRFFDSTNNYFGSYTDGFLSDLTGNPAYKNQQILLFSIQTGSAWANGFTGLVDGLSIRLTSANVGQVNFIAMQLVGDLNNDCKVDAADLKILCEQWLQPPALPSADIWPSGGDNAVNFHDLAVMANNWLIDCQTDPLNPACVLE